MNQKLIEAGVLQILKGMGVDLSDPNFKDTPKRVARMYAEMLTPNTNNWTAFPSTYNNMVILRGHKVFALCPHHLQVVELKAYVGYVPARKVLGLSKLARVVEQHLTRPIMQEELGELVVDSIEKEVDPKGAACVLAGEHGCLKYRGVRTSGDVVTSAVRGVFLIHPPARDEFMRLIGRP
jgi:GTP cyclohydrolase IA